MRVAIKISQLRDHARAFDFYAGLSRTVSRREFHCWILDISDTAVRPLTLGDRAVDRCGIDSIAAIAARPRNFSQLRRTRTDGSVIHYCSSVELRRVRLAQYAFYES